MTSAVVPVADKPQSPFSVFSNRSFSWMWSGQLVSTMGSALTSLAASIYVFRLTGSAASVGLMLMATAAPTLLVGLLAGVVVDRADRRRIMIGADLLRALVVFLIPFLVPHGIAWLYLLVALSSTVGQFFDPAFESVMPEVASEEELARANSLMAISSFGSTAIGFAASGLIAAAADISWAFRLDALSFLFSAFCISRIRVKPLVVQDEASVGLVIRNLKAGVRCVSGTPVLRSLFTVSLPVMVAFGLTNALLLPFALRALRANEFQYGIQEGLTSIGFVIGSLLMASLFDRWREGPWIVLSYVGMGLAGIAYAFTGSIALAIGVQMVSGLLNAPSAIARRTAMQRNTPREMRGRVASAFYVTRDVLFIVGMAAAGLADIVNVRLVYLVAALMVLGGGIWVLVLPGLRQEAAEWRRALSLLRSAPATSGLGLGRAVTLADFDTLAMRLPALASLSARERESLLSHGRVLETPAGATIVRCGDTGDAAYFILEGRAVAGVATPDGGYRSLSTMAAGDFFGEVAALTGARRTADVVAEDATRLLMLPGASLRALMNNRELGALFLSTMGERLARTSINELPRFAGYDQAALKELRTAEAQE